MVGGDGFVQRGGGKQFQLLLVVPFIVMPPTILTSFHSLLKNDKQELNCGEVARGGGWLLLRAAGWR